MSIERIDGICWPHASTVGHMTPATPWIRGQFPATYGSDGVACCDLVAAGKYRNGAARSWCRIHQHYWGTKADLAALATHATARCARHADPVHYARDPLRLDLDRHAQVHIALAGGALEVSIDGGTPQRHPALALHYDSGSNLFPAADICQLNITPTYVQALLAAPSPGCVCCARCGHPHLDLGAFGTAAHKRHYCGHCGNDSTHSKQPIVSHPLVPLLDNYRAALKISSSIVHRDNML